MSSTHDVVIRVNVPVLFLKPFRVLDVARFEVELGAYGCVGNALNRTPESWDALSRLQQT